MIEKVIDAAIPLWELTLAPLYAAPEFSYFRRIPCDRIQYVMDAESTPDSGSLSIDVDEVNFGQGDPTLPRENQDKGEHSDDSKQVGDEENNPEDENDGGDDQGSSMDGDDASASSDEDVDEDDNDDEEEDDEEEPWEVILPDPDPFDAANHKLPTPPDFKQLYGEKGRTLQVIVKLANIELTPEKPRYEGGTWHVEGKQVRTSLLTLTLQSIDWKPSQNEHICATAIYYYSSDNIKYSELQFQQFIDAAPFTKYNYPQNDHGFLFDLFGLANEDAGTQHIGELETCEGRLITFPNILMHQVQPFELEDKTRNGHRKILALFLVDPNVRIASTGNVPCQRLDWWRKATSEAMSGEASSAKGLDKLPVELRDQVYDGIEDFPISLKEAKELREELMAERTNFVRVYKQHVHRMNAFSLCEH